MSSRKYIIQTAQNSKMRIIIAMRDKFKTNNIGIKTSKTGTSKEKLIHKYFFQSKLLIERFINNESIRIEIILITGFINNSNAPFQFS